MCQVRIYMVKYVAACFSTIRSPGLRQKPGFWLNTNKLVPPLLSRSNFVQFYDTSSIDEDTIGL